MKQFFSMSIVLSFILLCGCSGKNFGSRLMPSSEERQEGNWQTYEEAMTFYDSIQEGETTIHDLQNTFNFDPYAAKNTKALGWTGVKNVFTGKSSFTSELPDEVQKCLFEEQDVTCDGFVILRSNIKKRGEGNIILYLSRLKVTMHTTGWKLKMLIVTKGQVVVFKDRTATPNIDKITVKREPAKSLFGLGIFAVPLLF